MNTEPYQSHIDALNSRYPTETEEGGAASGVQRTTAFGEVRSRGGEMPTAYQYTGQLSQMEPVGLYHYGARWYDPAGAHFTQADTLIPGVGNSLSWDRYAYVNDNPINYTDPTGHMQVCADGDEGGGCGTGSTTEQIYTSFDYDHGGAYDGLFAETYAKMYAARLASARGDPNAEIYWSHAASSYQISISFVSQEDFRFNPVGLSDPISVLKFSEAAVSLGKDAFGAGISASAMILKPGSAGGLTAGKPFPESVRNQAFQEDPTLTCMYCGRPGVGTDVDHIVPKSKGGNATIDNAQLACPHCNRSRGNRDYPLTPPLYYEGPWPAPWWP